MLPLSPAAVEHLTSTGLCSGNSMHEVVQELESFAETQKKEDDRFFATFPGARVANHANHAQFTGNQLTLFQLGNDNAYHQGAGTFGFYYDHRNRPGRQYYGPCLPQPAIYSPQLETPILSPLSEVQNPYNSPPPFDKADEPTFGTSLPSPDQPIYGYSTLYYDSGSLDGSSQMLPSPQKEEIIPFTPPSLPPLYTLSSSTVYPSSDHPEPLMDFLPLHDSPLEGPCQPLMLPNSHIESPVTALGPVSHPVSHALPASASPQAHVFSEAASSPNSPSLPYSTSPASQIPPEQSRVYAYKTAGASGSPQRPSKRTSTAQKQDRKPSLACFFCRGRKIACGPVDEDSPERTCNQCQRRSLKCEFPTQSRRGMRKKKSNPQNKDGVIVASEAQSLP
ncbi:hypothetical protein C8J56DRAFT_918575 [Mycena floridula]|nr:hypothetical protein C8J56DRAFT_918575 [Mycena floridula]